MKPAVAHFWGETRSDSGRRVDPDELGLLAQLRNRARPDIAETLAHLRRNVRHDLGSDVQRQGVEDDSCGPCSKSLDDACGRAHTHVADDRPPIEGRDVLDLHESCLLYTSPSPRD